jgi:hypothetical protein
MYGINKKRLIENLERLRKHRCVYSSDVDMCDCKFGNDEKNITDNKESFNGCPELRQVIILLNSLSDDNFKKLCKIGDINIYE